MRLLQNIGLAAALLVPLGGGAAERARIGVVGDLDSLTVGQDGYCGERTQVDKKAWRGIFVDGDERTWFGIKATVQLGTGKVDCSGEFSFVPAAAQTYIIRYTWAAYQSDQCLFELFRVVPGGDPVRENLTREQPQVCLIK